MDILKGRDGKYIWRRVVVAGGQVVHQEADKDETTKNWRVQDEGVVPPVHYIPRRNRMPLCCKHACDIPYLQV